ncbi:LysR family transcriptional regulator [Paenibacillus sepulcri]|uniref:LysR family transcriptional regulator n=1 Tax=Paenibacillus sepulcri TaxID=359917 RepID=A0ABS7CC89_9BACL|nr:LysR family transcriptional regulator [Paenibacillus sepulcri]
MNIVHLETFLTVSECKNISEAAKRLFVPQPTVSNRIRFMEESLSCELFVRSKKGVELTEQGRIMLPYAENLVETYNLAVQALSVKPSRKELNIGSTLPFTFPFILDKLEHLYSHNPELSLQMLSVDSGDVVHSLSHRNIDMAFAIQTTNQKEVEEHQIGSEALHLVLSTDHPLAAKEFVPELLEKELEFVVYYQTYFDMFQHHQLMKLPYRRRFLTNHAGLIKQLVMRMNAISFLPLSFVSNEIKRGELTYIPLEAASFQLSIPYYLIFRKNEKYFEEILLGKSESSRKNSQPLLKWPPKPDASRL